MPTWTNISIKDSESAKKAFEELFNKKNENKFNADELVKLDKQLEAWGQKVYDKSVQITSEKETYEYLKLQILTTQLELMKKQISDLDNKKSETFKYFIYGGIVAIIATAIPKGIELLQTQPPIQKIEFPKVYLIHDTIYSVKYDTLKIK